MCFPSRLLARQDASMAMKKHSSLLAQHNWKVKSYNGRKHSFMFSHSYRLGLFVIQQTNIIVYLYCELDYKTQKDKYWQILAHAQITCIIFLTQQLLVQFKFQENKINTFLLTTILVQQRLTT